MKKILIFSLFSLAIIACSSASEIEEGVEMESDTVSVMPFRGARLPGGSTNLVDHGGKLLPNSNTYAIWWGNNFPSDAQAGLTSMFEGLNGSSILNLTTQYMRGSSVSSSFHVNWNDTSNPPSHNPSVYAIANEACKVITQNGEVPDTNGIYFVYTSTFPRGTNFCAWHSYGICNGVTIQIAYMPNTTGIAGCDPGNLYNCNSYSQGTRSLANVTSHEFMEAITDATISAWYDSSGAENGDKCAWKFSKCVTLTNSSWQLQQEWSNASSSCVQQ